MLRLLTRMREVRKKPSKSLLQESLSALRSQRLFYIMCSLFFIIDNQCSIPMHTLLTDVIYIHGGTTELVQIMNRLGMISSEDTHTCYVDYVVHHSNSIYDIDRSDTVIATLDNMAQQWKSYSQSLQTNCHWECEQCKYCNIAFTATSKKEREEIKDSKRTQQQVRMKLVTSARK